MKYLVTLYVVNPHASEDGVHILPESAMTHECADDKTIYEASFHFLLLHPEYWSLSVLKQGDLEGVWHAVAYIINPAYDPAKQAERIKTSVKMSSIK